MSRVKPRASNFNIQHSQPSFKRKIIFKVVWGIWGTWYENGYREVPRTVHKRNAKGKFILPMASSRFRPISQPPLPIKHGGTQPPTRDTPGSSAGGIVRLPNSVCPGVPVLEYLKYLKYLKYLTFIIPVHTEVFPVIPHDPRVPGFWSPTVTCQTCLRKGTRHGCWCLGNTGFLLSFLFGRV